MDELVKENLETKLNKELSDMIEGLSFSDIPLSHPYWKRKEEVSKILQEAKENK